ncbi:MAG: hypothetical protein EZS28_010781 [Streblomastix strix]|uniref:Uncharacterized protein n=1 Tax=Streblomastix strix TaxID=222440 RepID=A0A5J4WFN5_9EUKA|nr:MAG: hypothetical protein EZS28_010781 [Streblomastix strix]
MRKEIIHHLITIADDEDDWVREESRDALYYLAQNYANLSEITKQLDLRSFASDLMKPLVYKQSKRNEQQQQELKCQILSCLLRDRENDTLRMQIIEAGIVDSLFHVYTTRVLAQITQPYINVFYQLTVNTSDEVLSLISEKKPYHSLFWLLDLKDDGTQGIYFAILSIYNFLLSGISKKDDTNQHPHFDDLQTCDGVDKLFNLFKRDDIQINTKNLTAICIGLLFKAKEIVNQQMRYEVVSYLKLLISDFDEWIRNASELALCYMLQNSVNYSEIENLIDLNQISEDLKRPSEGDEEQQQFIQQQQDGDCTLLIVMLNTKKDNIEFSKSIISSGIVDSLLFIFETRDITLITIPVVQIFNQLTKVNDEINQLLYERKNPYPQLFKLLSPNSSDVLIKFSINSIFNIIVTGDVTSQHQEQHPHFQDVKQCDGIESLYSLFKRANIYKLTKDSAAICFGNLFKAKEIPNDTIRSEIISHLKINREEIEKDGFKLPE